VDGVIRRDPRAARDERFDLVIVGAGIYGAAAALAAARAGHRTLLLERDDFGGATSWNSFRILHGGLRYLQRLDLVRFRESVVARSWFFDELPGVVEPLACLMPLYGEGVRRRATLGPALALNELLRRLWSSEAELAALPGARLVPSADVVRRYPGVRRDGLRGGALWFDGLLPQPQRALMEILRRAAAAGAVALNYLEATGWAIEDGRVTAVRAVDTLTGSEHEFRTALVLNCAGPWAAELVAAEDPALGAGFHRSLAFNLLLDHPLDSDVSVAIEPAGGGRTYFLHPMGDRTLAGTYHAPLSGSAPAEPTEAQIEEFLADLREASPGFDATSADVRRVLAGVLPARREGIAELSGRPLVHHAAADGGPRGLHSVVGVKYTTAPLVAARAVTDLLGEGPAPSDPAAGPAVREVPGWPEFAALAARDAAAAGALVEALVEEESVVRPDDLLLRRTDWGLDPGDRREAAALIRRLRPALLDPARVSPDE